MSRILVSVSPIPGHVNPLLILAEELQRRGHDVFFQVSEVFRENVEAAGLSFRPLRGKANYDYRLIDEIWPERRKTEAGLPQLNFDFTWIFADTMRDQYEEMVKVIDEEEIDLVLTEVCFHGVIPLILGPFEQRPPVISCGILPYLTPRSKASPFAGFDETPEGLKRNAEHNRMVADALAPYTAHVNEILKQYVVTTPPGFSYDGTRTLPDRFLQLTAEEFEYPLDDRPKNLLFVGPVAAKAMAKVEEPEWLKALDGSKPVVFITQGTIANFDFNHLVVPAIHAMADEGVQVVVTGGGVDVSHLPKLPNVQIERYLPYHLILPKTDVFITNGGYNGVQQALSFGVPVIAAGATEDKPFVAARAAWSGAGIDLKTEAPTQDQIRDAVRLILNDPSYRERAKQLKQDFARYDMLATSVMAVETAIAESNWRPGSGNRLSDKMLVAQ